MGLAEIGGFLAIPGDIDGKAGLGQIITKSPCQFGFVFSNKDADFALPSSRLPPRRLSEKAALGAVEAANASA